LLDADYSSSSVEPLVKLKALSNQDLISLFIAQVSPLRLNPLNRVVFYRNFAKAMFKERGIKPSELIDAIDRSIKSPEDFFGFYEQKILGLMDATEEIGEGAKSLAEVVKKYLEYRMETDTRFRFLKFAYKYTKDEEILKKALNCKSKKIRSWAMKEMENLR
jgi:predicted CopG family antitoxin